MPAQTDMVSATFMFGLDQPSTSFWINAEHRFGPVETLALTACISWPVLLAIRCRHETHPYVGVDVGATLTSMVETSIVRQGDYGFDAPYVPVIFGLLSLGFLTLAVLNATQGAVVGVIATLLAAMWFFGCMASYIYTTRTGKFVVWSQVLDEMNLTGQEQVLDLGCGRGAVLLLAAERLDGGRAHGVDLWRSQDQSGNAVETTTRNAEAEGVADRVELHTADMTELPFSDGQFDVVVSSLAIHNITSKFGRQQVINEALRVLRPGGRLAIADFRHVARYAETLSVAGLSDVRTRGLGWRFWYGGPWAATRLVQATKPDRIA